MSTQNKLDKATYLSVGLVTTMLAAAFSFGIMYQKVDDVDERVARVENKLDLLLVPPQSTAMTLAESN